jgi:hypothetical protein
MSRIKVTDKQMLFLNNALNMIETGDIRNTKIYPYRKDGYYATMIRRVISNGEYSQSDKKSLNELRTDFINNK